MPTAKGNSWTPARPRASRDLRAACSPRFAAHAWPLALAIAALVAGSSGGAAAAGPGSTETGVPIKPRAQAKPAAKAKPAVPLAKGKVAVFVFIGDPGPVRDEVVQLLRARRLTVITSLRPVDRAEQFREMANTLGLSAYVDGEVNDDGKRETAIVHLRSAVTGQRIASARFSGHERTLSLEVRRNFWNQLGPALARACAVAAKPRRQERAPMRIEAGTPIEDTPVEAQEGT